MALIGTVFFAFVPVCAESIGLWVAVVILVTYTLLTEKYDAIIMNGALMALYLAVLTS